MAVSASRAISAVAELLVFLMRGRQKTDSANVHYVRPLVADNDTKQNVSHVTHLAVTKGAHRFAVAR